MASPKASPKPQPANLSRPSSSAGNTLSPPQKLSSLSTSAVSSTASTPLNTPHKDFTSPSPGVSHRSSFAENFRNYPPSPRNSRTYSFSGAALTELLMNPPTGKTTEVDERFKGRDWRTIQVNEIIDPAETRFVELDTSIEDSTKLLIRSGAPNVVLVRESRKTKTAIDTFGYDELMAYLLLVLGMTQPDDLATDLANRARAGEVLPLKEIFDHLGRREPPTFIPHTASLTRAMEVLGGGLHRVIVCKEGTSEAVGVLTQLRLVRFFWENHQNFAVTESLYARSLKDLEMGAKVVVAINGDKPLSEALRLMHDEGITSLPVLDSHSNVIGNISHVDTRLLTDTSAIPLLSNSCIHFIGVILSERGVQDGKDSYPVFHVTPFSTLAHTVAKLCATRSHRMWIVDAPSPSGSVPPSPAPGVFHAPPFSTGSSNVPPLTPATPNRHGSGSEGIGGPMSPMPGSSISSGGGVSVSAGQLPGAAMSGRLSGVVSLTDVLNVLARASGLSPGDPDETRRRRRRSSSSSTWPHADSIRGSSEFATRSSEEISRTTRSGSRGSRR